MPVDKVYPPQCRDGVSRMNLFSNLCAPAYCQFLHTALQTLLFNGGKMDFRVAIRSEIWTPDNAFGQRLRPLKLQTVWRRDGSHEPWSPLKYLAADALIIPIDPRYHNFTKEHEWLLTVSSGLLDANALGVRNLEEIGD